MSERTAAESVDDADRQPNVEPQPDAPSAGLDPTEQEASPSLYARVEWVRPTDLAQRAGSKVLEQGVITHRQLRAALTDARRSGGEYLRQALAERALAVQPDTPTIASDRALRREGVGR